MMRIALQRSSAVSGLNLGNYAVMLCGTPVDDRGKAAIDQLSKRSDSKHALYYDKQQMALSIDGKPVATDELSARLGHASDGGVVLETTTLGFVEILLCCKALHGTMHSIDCLYVEPRTYRRVQNPHLLGERDFELSGEIAGFRGIPGATRLLNDRSVQKTVFFLGYEGSRLRRAFTDLEVLRAPDASVVFGVPAFNAGWEMDSMANNVAVMREESVRNVYFCGADNPKAAADVLDASYQGLQPGETLLVAPIGTKPHGLGTALFVASHRDVGVIYDHPQRSSKRSSELGHWHLFSVSDFSQS